ncbi:ABC transporter permease subunit, partial [uncultured Nocardioides sp.]|uniref:ABC transporter permease subunit n=1 Tax=uncultured Nocardioides sp. TaxID=198441 RepID=UPI00262E4DCA
GGDAKVYVGGVVAGAAAQDPGVTVNVNYIQSFSDVALAAEAAQGHVANGADVLTGTAQMVVGATGVAAEHGALWFGTQANQTALGVDIVVASQVYKWEVVLQDIVDGVRAGDLGGEAHDINFANGGLVLEFNDNVDSGGARAVAEAAVYMRVVRSDMIATLQENYILAARAKGLKDRFILFRHGLRPSSLTLITLVGLNLAGMIAGTIVIERLFAIPGLGWRLFGAIFQRDYMMVQGITVLIAAFYVLVNAVVDFLYMAIDPRIRRRT